MSTGRTIGVDALPDNIIDYALAERAEAYRDPSAKPLEMVMIEQALMKFRGDKAKAARHIGWNRPKFYRRMEKFRIPRSFGKP